MIDCMKFGCHTWDISIFHRNFFDVVKIVDLFLKTKQVPFQEWSNIFGYPFILKHDKEIDDIENDKHHTFVPQNDTVKGKDH